MKKYNHEIFSRNLSDRLCFNVNFGLALPTSREVDGLVRNYMIIVHVISRRIFGLVNHSLDKN